MSNEQFLLLRDAKLIRDRNSFRDSISDKTKFCACDVELFTVHCSLINCSTSNYSNVDFIVSVSLAILILNFKEDGSGRP